MFAFSFELRLVEKGELYKLLLLGLEATRALIFTVRFI